MPFDATPPAIRRIMHKPKDNSRYGDEIRAEEREKEGAGREGRGVVGAKNSYLKMYLPSGSQESPSAWKVRFLPFCFCFRVYARVRTHGYICVRVRLPLYPRRCRNRGGTQIRASTHSDLHVCLVDACTCACPCRRLPATPSSVCRFSVLKRQTLERESFSDRRGGT